MALTVLKTLLALDGCSRHEVSFESRSWTGTVCPATKGEGVAKSALNMETHERAGHPSINMPKDKPPIAAGQVKVIR